MNIAPSRRSAEADARVSAPRPMHISLRAGERLFLNGAVLRADKKVTLELLNDATFLLENHVLQVEDTTTPMRQLYFAAQAMLMDPSNAAASRALFEAMARDLKRVLLAKSLLQGVEEALSQVAAQRPFHALKTLRGLFAEEARLIEGAVQDRSGRSPASTHTGPRVPTMASASMHQPERASAPGTSTLQ